MLKKIILYSLLLMLGSQSSLKAEIELVTVKWIPTVCLAPCVQNIAQQLLRIHGAAEFRINQAQGQADIRWKPKAPFSVDFLNTAMRMAGPAIHDIRVKVRGTILSTPDAVLLQSLGDNSQFLLLSPTQGKVNQYVPQASFNVHVLQPDVRAKFLQAEQTYSVAVVEGPLFEPIRTMGLYLIVEQASFNTLGPGAIPVP